MVRKPQIPEASPDLFSLGSKPGAELASTHPPADFSIAPRFILPSDLAEALSRLPDIELRRLAAAVQEELSRRNMHIRNMPSIAQPAGASATSRGPSKKANPKTPAIPGQGMSLPLTQSRINAIRAAFRAGVKPSAISRQFGVSFSAIQQALKGDE